MRDAGFPLHLATVAAHGVRAAAPETLPDAERSVPSAEPIYQTAVFDFPTIEASIGPVAGEGGYAYARFGHPNGRSLELTVAALEGSEDAVATASGMAAVAAVVLAAAHAGDRVLVQADAYGGTSALLHGDLARLGFLVEDVDAYDAAAVRAALERSPRAAVCLVDTISNPLVREADLAAIARACRAVGTVLVVDNTFATPIVCRPLELGAHAVLHSATKFLGGHHDLTAGVLAGDRALCAAARGVVKRFGATVPPFDAWLTSRGLRTLGVRMERAADNALALAAWLREQPKVVRVHHPGRGAVLSFELADGGAASRAVAALHLVTLTPSLGGTTTTVSHAATSSHRGLAAEARHALGITEGLLRLSVGIEALDDLRGDLTRALAAA